MSFQLPITQQQWGQTAQTVSNLQERYVLIVGLASVLTSETKQHLWSV